MAIMIKVDKRGTTLKQSIRIAVKSATKKLRLLLGISLLLNIVMGVFIIWGMK